MHLLDNYSQSFIVTNQQRVDAQREQFKVSSVSIANNNKFNITVQNTGQIPINITRIWIQDTTTSASPTKYDVGHSVVPNGILNNVGQGSAFPTISSQDAYSMQLVTSRGNTQQFSINSATSVPLNIQLYAFPTSVSSGFTTQVVMVVTNNSTGTLVNVIPTATVSPNPPGPPNCVLGVVSPTSSKSLSPGSTAIFSWPLTASGPSNSICTVTAQLQNGYPGQTVQTKVTITVVTLASTTYAANAGVLTIDYTSFRWAQTNSWNTGWSFNHAKTGFSMTIANNNQTLGGYKLWLSENSQLFFQAAGGSASPTSFYIVKSVNLNQNGVSVTGYVPDYQVSIDNTGGTNTVYFGSALQGSKSQGSTIQTMPAGEYVGYIVLYGKFAINQGDVGTQYAQTIPFVAVISN